MKNSKTNYAAKVAPYIVAPILAAATLTGCATTGYNGSSHTDFRAHKDSDGETDASLTHRSRKDSTSTYFRLGNRGLSFGRREGNILTHLLGGGSSFNLSLDFSNRSRRSSRFGGPNPSNYGR